MIPASNQGKAQIDGEARFDSLVELVRQTQCFEHKRALWKTSLGLQWRRWERLGKLCDGHHVEQVRVIVKKATDPLKTPRVDQVEPAMPSLDRVKMKEFERMRHKRDLPQAKLMRLQE